MATLLDLPALTIVRGQQADFAWRITSAYPEPHSPVDLSEWTAGFLIAARLGADALLEVVPDIDEFGNASVTLTAAQTADIADSPFIGGRVTATYQLNLNAPDPSFNLVFQGGVSIARASE